MRVHVAAATAAVLVAFLAGALGVGCASLAVSQAPLEDGGRHLETGRLGGADPLILDRSDLAIGTTVHFDRLPTVNEMNDLLIFPALAHIVVSLDAWPDGYADLQALNLMPEGPDMIVILQGYPPSPIASDAWNQISGRVRLVLRVPGPPATLGVISDLNRMRHLERVIAEMDEPRRAGFERLQRPLSFRTFAR